MVHIAFVYAEIAHDGMAFRVLEIPGFRRPGADVILAGMAHPQGMAQLMHKGKTTRVTLRGVGDDVIVRGINKPGFAASRVLGVWQISLWIGLALFIGQMRVIANGQATFAFLHFRSFGKCDVCHIRKGLQTAPGLFFLRV